MTHPLPQPEQVETWLFDLDNTLYPASCRLFDQIDRRMGVYIQKLLALGAEEARAVQKAYFRDHGTTLRGLMTLHDVDPEDYLGFVHDIDHSPVEPNRHLTEALERLPGRKLIFTNASVGHAEKVLDRLGIEGHFEAIFDIAHASYIPKPAEAPYDVLIERHEIDPARTVFFEDSARNLEPAAARGMTTVWVEHEAEWSGAGESDPHYVHHRTRDLPAWLRGLLRD